jgi:hypothetical protein
MRELADEFLRKVEEEETSPEWGLAQRIVERRIGLLVTSATHSHTLSALSATTSPAVTARWPTALAKTWPFLYSRISP